MYELYVIVHFALMLIWLVLAIVLGYRFLRKFPQGTDQERLALLSNVRSLSDKIEMPASFFLPLVGILMIIEKTFWLNVGIMQGKIALALVAVGTYHASRGTLKKMMSAIEARAPVNKLANRYAILRVAVLVSLVTIVGMIISYKGTVSTFFLIRSWFS